MRKARFQVLIHLYQRAGKSEFDSISLTGYAAAIDMDGDVKTALILIDRSKGPENRFNVAVAGEVFSNLFVIHSEGTGTG